MRRAASSPYRKARSFAIGAAPLHLRGFPRRSRVLITACVCFCLLWLLPSSDWRIGETLLFLLISPEAARSYGGYGGSPTDILRFIDPLIGTANGGQFNKSTRSHAPSLRRDS